MFIKTFPIDIGTFVIVNQKDIDLTCPKSLQGRFGSVACYQCVDDQDDDYIIMVSGYKDNWCGEYLLSELLIATEEQIQMYKKYMHIS